LVSLARFGFKMEKKKIDGWKVKTKMKIETMTRKFSFEEG
jgi:hypothetical protein